MSGQETCNFEFKQGSLKEILELLGKLHNTESTKKNVFQQLKSYLGAYCSASYLNDFYKDEGSDYGSGYSYSGSGTIQLLTLAGENVSRQILQNPSWTSRFIDPHTGHSGQDCGEKYFKALKKCLPELFPALFFLFFNVSTECASFGGGSWNTLKVKGSGQNLYKWLIGDSSDGFIARKFSGGELHISKTGQNVAEELKKAVSLRPGSTEGSLQKVLCGFMFVCSWDPSLTGHACLFLYKFCSKVSAGDGSLEEKLKGYSGKLKTVCHDLQNHLEPFIGGSSGLYAVCHQNTNLFKDIWDDGKFDKYCDWLKRNLHHIIEALQDMSTDCKNWDSDKLQGANTPGPFLYGFVPKDNEWQNDMSHGKLQEPISKLTASLKKLLADLLFVFPWDDTLTGHACLFLDKFCSEILGGSESFLQDPYKDHSEAFKDVCRDLKDSLAPFTHASSLPLYAVCHGNTNLLDSLWDNEKISDYCTWLKRNVYRIIQSLKTMFLESPGWSTSTIQSASSAGPFKYGFVYKASWKDSTSMSTLQGYISKLTGEDSGSLQKFKTFLESPSTPSSAGATAGGVFTGLFGLGGAGAGVAYATNAFGFQNLVTSLLSSFLK
ncbi:secreted antigen 1 [Babesia divergens]|uniref:Secreted antigen 1 n=1 Tax=Babesia divergens TaxID=32595 RepID=A0AAD9LE41_BABDI|nr:secreted antigen 1 [Babesia divergens]